MIHALIDTTRVVGSIELDGAIHEVCAEAIGNHNRSENLLSVNLRAFLRSTAHEHLGEVAAPDWLPSEETVTEHVEAGEAHEMVNDIFSLWCRKVSDAVP